MDIVIRAPGIAAPFYVDLTIVSALSVNALAGGADVTDGAAGAIPSKKKVRDYPNCAVAAFVVEARIKVTKAKEA